MSEQKGILLVFTTALLSGFAVFLNKFALATINPTLFTFLKNAIVGILLIGLILFLKEWKEVRTLSPRKWGQLVLIGLVGGAIPFVLFFQGLAIATAASGAFIQKTLFLFSSILAVVLLREKMNLKMVGAASALLAGNFLLLNISSFTFGEGEWLILLATLFWALENIISKHALQTLSGNIVGAARMTLGGGFILLYLLYTGGISGIFSLTADAWMWVAFTSGMLFLYVYTYYNGLKLVPVSVATSILLLGSPITLLLSTLVGGTTISLSQVIGILLVGIGIVLALQAHAHSFPVISPAQLHTRNES
ncbi:MAG: DMT family transporter [Candidatus Diapherotrites archaeon]